ncbi:MAG: glycosyltransferase, partial [Candidatus Nealsonbacteria bacterium]|nr:glycosyltransferase [Candidatus Nealsonbacteria bacterium]
MSEVYLSVIIPAYNEEKRLPKTLAAISDYLKKQNYSSEIIVVDADSSDKTAEIARQFSVKVIELK